MEISALSQASQVNSAQGVAKTTSLAMLNKTLDFNEQAGETLTKMMEQSVNPHIGGNLDLSV